MAASYSEEPPNVTRGYMAGRGALDQGMKVFLQ